MDEEWVVTAMCQDGVRRYLVDERMNDFTADVREAMLFDDGAEASDMAEEVNATLIDSDWFEAAMLGEDGKPIIVR